MFNIGPYDFGPGSEAHERQMAKQRLADESLFRARLDALEEVGKAALAWRSAEIHAGAITLGIREGDIGEASDIVTNRGALLRIAIDKFNKVK